MHLLVLLFLSLLCTCLGRVRFVKEGSILFCGVIIGIFQSFTLSKNFSLHHLELSHMRRGSKSSELRKVLSLIIMGTKSDSEAVVYSFCNFSFVASSS